MSGETLSPPNADVRAKKATQAGESTIPIQVWAREQLALRNLAEGVLENSIGLGTDDKGRPAIVYGTMLPEDRARSDRAKEALRAIINADPQLPPLKSR